MSTANRISFGIVNAKETLQMMIEWCGRMLKAITHKLSGNQDSNISTNRELSSQRNASTSALPNGSSGVEGVVPPEREEETKRKENANALARAVEGLKRNDPATYASLPKSLVKKSEKAERLSSAYLEGAQKLIDNIKTRHQANAQVLLADLNDLKENDPTAYNNLPKSLIDAANTGSISSKDLKNATHLIKDTQKFVQQLQEKGYEYFPKRGWYIHLGRLTNGPKDLASLMMNEKNFQYLEGISELKPGQEHSGIKISQNLNKKFLANIYDGLSVRVHKLEATIVPCTGRSKNNDKLIAYCYDGKEYGQFAINEPNSELKKDWENRLAAPGATLSKLANKYGFQDSANTSATQTDTNKNSANTETHPSSQLNQIQTRIATETNTTETTQSSSNPQQALRRRKTNPKPLSQEEINAAIEKNRQDCQQYIEQLEKEYGADNIPNEWREKYTSFAEIPEVTFTEGMFQDMRKTLHEFITMVERESHMIFHKAADGKPAFWSCKLGKFLGIPDSDPKQENEIKFTKTKDLGDKISTQSWNFKVKDIEVYPIIKDGKPVYNADSVQYVGHLEDGQEVAENKFRAEIFRNPIAELNNPPEFTHNTLGNTPPKISESIQKNFRGAEHLPELINKINDFEDRIAPVRSLSGSKKELFKAEKDGVHVYYTYKYSKNDANNRGNYVKCDPEIVVPWSEISIHHDKEDSDLLNVSFPKNLGVLFHTGMFDWDKIQILPPVLSYNEAQEAIKNIPAKDSANNAIRALEQSTKQQGVEAVDNKKLKNLNKTISEYLINLLLSNDEHDPLSACCTVDKRGYVPTESEKGAIFNILQTQIQAQLGGIQIQTLTSEEFKQLVDDIYESSCDALCNQGESSLINGYWYQGNSGKLHVKNVISHILALENVLEATDPKTSMIPTSLLLPTWQIAANNLGCSIVVSNKNSEGDTVYHLFEKDGDYNPVVAGETFKLNPDGHFTNEAGNKLDDSDTESLKRKMNDALFIAQNPGETYAPMDGGTINRLKGQSTDAPITHVPTSNPVPEHTSAKNLQQLLQQEIDEIITDEVIQKAAAQPNSVLNFLKEAASKEGVNPPENSAEDFCKKTINETIEHLEKWIKTSLSSAPLDDKVKLYNLIQTKIKQKTQTGATNLHNPEDVQKLVGDISTGIMSEFKNSKGKPILTNRLGFLKLAIEFTLIRNNLIDNIQHNKPLIPLTWQMVANECEMPIVIGFKAQNGDITYKIFDGNGSFGPYSSFTTIRQDKDTGELSFFNDYNGQQITGDELEELRNELGENILFLEQSSVDGSCSVLSDEIKNKILGKSTVASISEPAIKPKPSIKDAEKHQEEFLRNVWEQVKPKYSKDNTVYDVETLRAKITERAKTLCTKAFDGALIYHDNWGDYLNTTARSLDTNTGKLTDQHEIQKNEKKKQNRQKCHEDFLNTIESAMQQKIDTSGTDFSKFEEVQALAEELYPNIRDKFKIDTKRQRKNVSQDYIDCEIMYAIKRAVILHNIQSNRPIDDRSVAFFADGSNGDIDKTRNERQEKRWNEIWGKIKGPKDGVTYKNSIEIRDKIINKTKSKVDAAWEKLINNQKAWSTETITKQDLQKKFGDYDLYDKKERKLRERGTDHFSKFQNVENFSNEICSELRKELGIGPSNDPTFPDEEIDRMLKLIAQGEVIETTLYKQLVDDDYVDFFSQKVNTPAA